MIVALAPAPAAEIEFERDRCAHRGHRRFHRLIGDQGTAEIGVQHGTGAVMDRLEAGRGGGLEQRERGGRGVLGANRRTSCACRAERLAHRVDGRRPAKAVDGEDCRLRAQHLVDRWKLA